ncbi:MAG: tetratricopeptide repeat protein [Bdellovibrionota bacterium]
MSPLRKGYLFVALVAFHGTWSSNLFAQSGQSAWQVESQTKADATIQEDKADIERSRVVIRRKMEKGGPSIHRESISFDEALRQKRLEKTQALITQLEGLVAREGQSARRGELQMRLAELYFDRGRDVAVTEGESWRKAVEKWEALAPEVREKSSRPALKTPQADKFRKQSLGLYNDLEKRSRGADKGRSQLIERDEVLFYLGMTQVDLGQGKQASPHLEELLSKYPNSQRSFAARLQLADLYFDNANFKNALPLYLKLASTEASPELSKQVRPYVFYKMAWSYFNLGAYDKAVLAYKKTVELAQGNEGLSFKTEAERDLSRTFALAGQYDEGFEYFSGNQELQREHLRNCADLASSRGQTKLAIGFYDKLIDGDPKAAEAKDFALARMEVIRRSATPQQVAAQMGDFLKNYGADSSWISARSAEEQKQAIEEAVGMVRREAKSLHKSAQRYGKAEKFAAPEAFYKVYFQHVPEPNADTPENVHEMRFYYAELLYKMKNFDEAQKQYALVGEGKYGAGAAYNRILALKQIAGKDKDRARDLLDATETFIKKFPEDKRGSDLLYASAFEAYSSGEKNSSKETLLSVIERYPKSDAGLKSAERYLFLLEEQGDLDKALQESELLSKNTALMTAHATTLAPKVRDFQQRVNFKRIDKMDGSPGKGAAQKAEAYLAVAPSLTPELQEKALNNAVVFAGKSEDAELSKKASAELLKKFPQSTYSRSLYVQQGDELARKGDWRKALATYETYLNISAKDKTSKKEDIELALWNKIFIQSHLEDQVGVTRSRAPSKELDVAYSQFLKDYPRSKFRLEVLQFAAFQNGVSDADLAAWSKLGSLSSDERSLLDEARLARTLRSTPVKGRAAILKNWPSSKAKSLDWELRRTLAGWAFEALESDFAAYQRQRLNFQGAAFAKTLNQKKKSLEELEKKYLNAVAYGDGDVALKSLVRVANANRDFALELSKAPVPKEDLQAFVKPYEDKHVDLIGQCLVKAVDFKIAGAGLGECRDQMRALDPKRVPLQYETLLNPGFIQAPTDANTSPLWALAEKAFRENHEGEFVLAMKVMHGEISAGRLPKSWDEYMNNLDGLQSWRRGASDAAVKSFREALDTSGSEFRDLRRMAAMNLAAINNQIGDYAEADSLMEGLSSSSAEAAMIAGVAKLGISKSKDAASLFDDAYSNFKQHRELLLHAGIAWKAAGDNGKAVDRLKKYIELEAPSARDVSRQLLKAWRGN